MFEGIRGRAKSAEQDWRAERNPNTLPTLRAEQKEKEQKLEANIERLVTEKDTLPEDEKRKLEAENKTLHNSIEDLKSRLAALANSNK